MFEVTATFLSTGATKMSKIKPQSCKSSHSGGESLAKALGSQRKTVKKHLRTVSWRKNWSLN